MLYSLSYIFSNSSNTVIICFCKKIYKLLITQIYVLYSLSYIFNSNNNIVVIYFCRKICKLLVT